MSKIVPKSMQSQSSQNIKSHQHRKENTESEVMFAALFGGASGVASTEESLIGKASMKNLMSADSDDDGPFGEQTSDNLMMPMASFHGGRGFGQKIDGLQSDVSDAELELEQAATLSDNANPEAVALALDGSTLPEKQGGTMAMPKSAMAGLANMLFEDGVGPNARTVSATANVVSKNPARVDGNSLLGQNQAATEIIGPQQVQKNSAKVGENLAINMEKDMTSEVVKLRALRAANLEQLNADIDKESVKADFDELGGKWGKNGQTVGGLKQMVVSNASPLLNVKAPSLREGGRVTNDLTRLAAASSPALDNASAITGAGANGSSTGQSGAHTGHQGGTQSGPQTGGGLLGNLNNLQILDTAKDNWTEMLLQRVKSGLSGGKDQLDFQLNPRNLGKMRISLFMQNDRTNIHIQTETSAAASMLSDSESRLAQMLEASGLRLGNLNSGQFQGFGGAGSDQQANNQNQSETGVVNQPDDAQGEVVEELVTEGSDNLINIQA
jgi:flagellar hook-length control protein FliK